MAAVAEGCGTVADYIEQYQQRIVGDVWVVIPDGKPGMSGIYADDPESALAYYRETYEDAPAELDVSIDTTTSADPTSPTGFARQDALEASASLPGDRRVPRQQRGVPRVVRSAEWLCEHQDDDAVLTAIHQLLQTLHELAGYAS